MQSKTRAKITGVVSYLLVEEGLDVEGLHDVCVELREQEGVPDALVQQLPHLHRIVSILKA